MGYLSQCYITHFASDSASIFQQFTYMTAPKRRGVSEIPHRHAGHLPYIYLNHDSDCDSFYMSISGSVIFLQEASFQFVI